METTEHDDFVTIVDIPRLILMKSGKNISEAKKLPTESDNNPAATRIKTVVTLPPINEHLQQNQEVPDKNRRMVKVWMKVCHQLRKRNKSGKYRIKHSE